VRLILRTLCARFVSGSVKHEEEILFVLTLCVVLLASVLLINTLRFTSKQIQTESIQPVSVDEGSVAPRLAQAVRFQTVSYQDAGQMKGEGFLALHKYLEQTFPKVHSTLTKELVGGLHS
jgi:carboxypeptidase PM20D1